RGDDDLHGVQANDAARRAIGASLGLRPRRRAVPPLRDADPDHEAGARRAPHVLVPGMSALTWIALLAGASASAAALWGYYRELPGGLTGPEISQMEGGGCAILCRPPRAALLGGPNASLGMLLCLALAVGLLAAWPPVLPFAMTLPAVAMSAFL